MSFSCGSTEILGAWHLQFRWLVKSVLWSKMSKDSRSLFFLKAGLTHLNTFNWVACSFLNSAWDITPGQVSKLNSEWRVSTEYFNPKWSHHWQNGPWCLADWQRYSTLEVRRYSHILFHWISWPFLVSSCTVQWYNRADG